MMSVSNDSAHVQTVDDWHKFAVCNGRMLHVTKCLF